MNFKRWGTLLFLPLLIATIACVCTSALPFGGSPDVEEARATAEAIVGEIDVEEIEATAEAIAGEIDVEEVEATAAAAVETVEAATGEIPAGGEGEVDTDFPIPDELEQVILNEGDMLIITVNLSIEDTITFYREELTAMGLTERPLLTVSTEDTFSMVFDGWSDGRSVVVQGTTFGDVVSVSIRLEEV